MSVNARPGEPFEELYRRFKRSIEASGILREYRRKQRFIPAQPRARPGGRWRSPVAATVVDTPVVEALWRWMGI